MTDNPNLAGATDIASAVRCALEQDPDRPGAYREVRHHELRWTEIVARYDARGKRIDVA